MLRARSGGNRQVSSSLTRRLVAEAQGTSFLLAAVVGSGIMAERLASGNVALALLANTIAICSALVCLILTFTGIRPVDVPAFILAELIGASAAILLTRWLIDAAPAKEFEMSEKKRVLFLCTGNSARSQMAEGLLRAMAADRFEVSSAGTVATFVRPQAISAMSELDIDISHHRSQSVDEFLGENFDYVITVCDHANQHCPTFSGAVKRIHWSIDDPVGKGSAAEELAAFRQARDDLRERIK